MLFLGQAANYKGTAILRHLFAFGSSRQSARLKNHLAERYHAPESQVYLYHNGRSALAAALQALVPEGSGIIVNGFTCHAVAEAVRAAGCTPVYTNIQPDTLHFNLANLKETLKSHPTANIRTIIVQNTLGIPIDIAEIEEFAIANDLIIIEDLAHCAGRTYPDGREIGTVGAATALSFGKGKAIDTISGGALILRSLAEVGSSPSQLPPISDRLRDRWYPVFGRLIRTLYYIRLHKVFTALLLKLHWISRSADATLSTSVRLPHWQAKLALRQLEKMPPNEPQPPLRTFAFVKNRDQVLAELEKNGYKFDEIWYDVPVSPARYYDQQHFPEKECPTSVWIAKHIINFPTFYPKRKLKKAHEIADLYSSGFEGVPDRATGPEDRTTNITSDWATILQDHPEANFLQSPAWAKMNQLIGHQVLSRNFGDGNFALMIIKDAKRGRYLEIPGGPLIDWQDTKKSAEIFSEIREIAKDNHCAFIRLRPQLPNTPENLKTLKDLGAKPASFHLHAEHTVILDLEQSEDEILANMRRQTRYEVRRSLKQEIIVKSFTSEEKFRKFHSVQAETARRQNFVPPSLDTLLAEHEAFGDNARLYIAYTPSEESASPPSESNSAAPHPLPIAYGLILISGDEADYFEAASTDLNRKLPGAYALQWQVIRDLKKQGIKRYNLWGIAPPDQPHHRYAKVTTFKTGFGGDIVEFVPAHDIIINKVKYIPNLAVETIRKKRRHLS